MISYLLYKKIYKRKKIILMIRNMEIPLWMMLMLLSLNKHDEHVSLLQKNQLEVCA